MTMPSTIGREAVTLPADATETETLVGLGRAELAERLAGLGVPERQRRMRVDGTAQIAPDDELLALYPEAQFMVLVTARAIYPNCPRYIHHYQLVERSSFVPRAGQPTPIPGWKQTPWASDVLPAHDPARPR